MSVVLAIDPGSERSAWLLLVDGDPRRFGIVPNESLLVSLRHSSLAPSYYAVDQAVIEWMQPRGMPTSAQEFETLCWIGRFMEAAHPLPVHRLARHRVKVHLCGNGAAKDANIRAALIDRFGGVGGKAAAVGTAKAPGPLHGVANDVWAALAVAVTFADGIR